MSYTFFNMREKGTIEIGWSKVVTGPYQFEMWPEGDGAEIPDDAGFIALKVDHGFDFKVDLKAGLAFTMVQVLIDDPKYKGKDTYVFEFMKQVPVSGTGVTLKGGGDGEVGDPDEDIP